MNVLLLGAGAQGKATLYDLCKNKEIKSIIVVENNRDQIEEFLNKFPDDRIKCLSADANNSEEMLALMQNADIIIDLLPTIFRKHITKLAIKSKTNLVNTSFHTNIKKHTNAATQARIIVMPESGLDPGIDLILAAHAIKQFDKVTEFHSACGGVPVKDACDNPLNYKISWIFEGVLSAYTRPADIIVDGNVKKIPGKKIFNYSKEILVPDVGEFDRYPNGRASTYARVLGIDNTVVNMGRYTYRWKGHSEFWKKIVDLGLLDNKPVLGILPKTFLSKALSPKLQYKDSEKDLVVLRNEVTGIIDGKEKKFVQQLIDERDLETGFMAMNRTVGFSASIIAQMILSGKISGRGILNPGKDVPYEEFISEIAKKGIVVTEEFEC